MAPGETAFITFRLHGSIPAATARELKAALATAHAVGFDHRRAQKPSSPSSTPYSTGHPSASGILKARSWPMYWLARL